jgi:hypothetical protein
MRYRLAKYGLGDGEEDADVENGERDSDTG